MCIKIGNLNVLRRFSEINKIYLFKTNSHKQTLKEKSNTYMLLVITDLIKSECAQLYKFFKRKLHRLVSIH